MHVCVFVCVCVCVCVRVCAWLCTWCMCDEEGSERVTGVSLFDGENLSSCVSFCPLFTGSSDPMLHRPRARTNLSAGPQKNLDAYPHTTSMRPPHVTSSYSPHSQHPYRPHTHTHTDMKPQQSRNLDSNTLRLQHG